MPPALATPEATVKPAATESNEPEHAKPVQAAPPMPSPIDDKVKRFAEFFNGQVVEMDLDASN